ncbi:MAG: phosphatidate cytidylyltransferase [Oscillospiraceae bacterium]|nr:phosphatidate cytidylyltransferase [Oscillospiraceae bacterium]
MKKRIIVSVIALPLLVLLIFFAPLGAFGCFAGLVSCIAATEFLRCTETSLNKRITAYTAAVAASIPILTAFSLTVFIMPVFFALITALFAELLISFRFEKPMDIETVANCVFTGAVMPMLLSALVRLGDTQEASVYILLPFVTAFSCDSGAYFAGMAFGRHKLAPRLSPNKTIEGSIGGFFGSVLFMLIYGLVLRSAGFEVDLTVMALFGFLGGLMCQFGDLCFSAIKRVCGAKDFGGVIPGHGGVLDRFDSIYFAAPLIEILVLWTTPILPR